MNETENFHRNVSKEINLDNLYSALVQCFCVIICGYGAGRLNLITERETRGLGVLVSTFALPSVIFVSLAKLDMSHVNWTFLASILVSKGIVFFGVMVLTFCLIRPTSFGRLGLYAVFCTQSNDFAIGYPILSALYGKDHPDYPLYVYLLTPISLVVLNPIAYVLLEVEKYRNKKEEAHTVENGAASQQIQSDGVESGRKAQIEPLPSLCDAASKSPPEDTRGRTSIRTAVFLNIISNPVVIMTLLGMGANFIVNYIGFVVVILEAFSRIFSTTALFVLGLRMKGTVSQLKGGALLTPGILIITKLDGDHCVGMMRRTLTIPFYLESLENPDQRDNIISKLVFPLVTREIVSLLRPGVTANDTVDLSSLGFIYGTFPTAPMAFVLSTQYDIDFEKISTSLVACTFLSGPLMYISAKMIFLDFLPTDDYYKKLQSFEFNVGVIGIPLGVWLVIIFIANKSFSKIPHKISGCLIISQVLLCVGVALEPLVAPGDFWFEYIQLSIVAVGLYSSRLWTCILAITLAVLQSRSLCFVLKLVPFFICLGWGVPVILVSAVCFTSFPDHPFGSLINPTFRYGVFQSVVTLFVLAASFLGTSVCLILQHRYQKKFAKYLVLVQEINSKDLREVNETNIGECSRGSTDSPCNRRITDIEEIVPINEGNLCSGNCDQEGGLCSSKFSCTDSQRELCEETLKQYNEDAVNEEMDEDRQDRQMLRHIVLLLLLVTSMFVVFVWLLRLLTHCRVIMRRNWSSHVRLTRTQVFFELEILTAYLESCIPGANNSGDISVQKWYTVWLQTSRQLILLAFLLQLFCEMMEKFDSGLEPPSGRWLRIVEDGISGVYIELLFLNGMLNTGQIFLTFAVFGFESRGLVVSVMNRWRKFYYGADTVVLTPVEELGFETTHVCQQFIAHHLQDCERDIAENKRLRLRLHKDCFRGRALVAWLETKHLAKNEAEAIQYASHLLEGRVIRHVENRHHFENSDLLYTFRQ